MPATKTPPMVSVIIPSYNHERFIRDCIESVLSQTFQDFEIIITDDGSVDNTVNVIKNFSDPRIKLFVHIENRGACIAANNCLIHSSGKYIAMLSSDDIWYPRKLELQVDYLENHPDIAGVFGKVDWIDDENQLITDDNFYHKDLFNVENRTRFEWLGRFFKQGNCLCHPSSLIRRECYDEIGMFNPSLASLPDLDLWIRLCFKYQIHILDQKLLRFRRLNSSENASGNNLANQKRARFEFKQLLDHYLDIKDPQELVLILPQAALYGKVSPDIITYFLGRVAIATNHEFKELWGLEIIYKLLQDKKTAAELERSCGFGYRDFIRLTGEFDPFAFSKLAAIPMPAAKIQPPAPTIIIRKSRLFLILSKIFLKNILSAVQSVFVAISKYIKDLYSITLNPDRSQSKLQLPEPTDKIKFSLDALESVPDDQFLYRLSGWAFLDEEPDQSSYERSLVLKSKTRTYFYPVTSLQKKDPQKVSKGSDKQLFHAILSRAVILPDIYSLGVLFKYPAKGYAHYAVTDKMLVHAAGQLQLKSSDLIHKSQTSKVKNFILTVNSHLRDIFSSGSQND